uniref:Uncharacterized protein n=1 Tax=Rhizophora mucronata TaxID=61149 RepID=A0A2P2PNZ8_RHIMU
MAYTGSEPVNCSAVAKLLLLLVCNRVLNSPKVWFRLVLKFDKLVTL